MLSDELIQRGGSKLEGTRLVMEKDKDIPVPRSAFYYHGGSIDSLVNEVKDFRLPLILRGSERYDWRGRVGAVPTFKRIYSTTHLTQLIEQTQQFMESKDFRFFVQDEGISYTPDVHFLVQEQEYPKYLAHMLRHPNQKHRIFINTVVLLDRGNRISDKGDRGCQHYFVYDENEDIIEGDDIEHDIIRPGIEVFKKAEKLFGSDDSFVSEIGLDKTVFLQGKGYLPRQDPFFKIDLLQYDFPILIVNEAFGITKPEGIHIPCVNIKRDHFWQDPEFLQNPYGNTGDDYMLHLNRKDLIACSRYHIQGDKKNRDDMSLLIPIGRPVLLTRSADHIDLMHGTYRIMSRSGFFGFDTEIRNFPFENMQDSNAHTDLCTILPSDVQDCKGLRYISDGRIGVLFLEEHL